MAINKTLWTTFRAKDFVSSEIKMMQKSMNNFTNSTVKNFKKMERHATILNNSMKKMSSGFGKYMPFAGGLGAVGLFAGGRSAVESAAQLESLATVIKSASGTTEEGARSMQFLSDLSKNLKIDFIAASEGFSLLAANAKASKIPMEEMRQVFEGVSKLIRVQGLDAQKSMSVYRAIGQMYSKQTVQAQEATIQLAEAMPAAKALLAEAFKPGASMKEFTKAMEQGKLVSKDILPIFSRLAGAMAEDGLGASLETATAKLTDLSNQWLMTKATIGTALIDAGVIDALQKGAGLISEWVKGNKELLKLNVEGFLKGTYSFFSYVQENQDSIKNALGAIFGVWLSVKTITTIAAIKEAVVLLGSATMVTAGAFATLAGAIGWSIIEANQFREGADRLNRVMNPAEGFGAGFINFFNVLSSDYSWRSPLAGLAQLINSILQSVQELFALIAGGRFTQLGRYLQEGARWYAESNKRLDEWANPSSYGGMNRTRREQMASMNWQSRAGIATRDFLPDVLSGDSGLLPQIPLSFMSTPDIAPVENQQQDALSSNGLTNEKIELIIKNLSENIVEADTSGAPSYNLRFSE